MLVYVRVVAALCLWGIAVGSGPGMVVAQSAATTLEAKTTKSKLRTSGVPTSFFVNPGWQADRFPEHAVCYLPPEKIASICEQSLNGKGKPITSYEKPADGSLRIVGTGHSFMAPGYKTLPEIVRAAGFLQPPMLTHTGGGITGSARYKWEQENGIFEFDGNPKPLLLSSIAGAKWDAMMWGPYYNDKPEYYSCWMEFCLTYNPEMKFYLSDAWPQLDQLDAIPRSEDELTAELAAQMHQSKRSTYAPLIETLNKRYGNRVYVLPTSQALVLAVEHYHRGELPGVKGLHKSIGQQDRSLWRDKLGHLGNGMESLEGYVFYATLYGRSPELIPENVFKQDETTYPSLELDKMFRKIAWNAAITDPLSGVIDHNKNGIADDRE